MRDFDPTASEFVSSGFLAASRPGGRLYDPGTLMAGASIVGGLIGSDAASSAADTQSASTDRATAAQTGMFNTQVALQEPWRQAGGLGLNALLYGMGLSPTGTFTPGASPAGAPPQMLTPGADGVFAPAPAAANALAGPVASTGALAQPVAGGGPSADQIRQWYDAGLLSAQGAGQPFLNRATGATIPADVVANAVSGFSNSGPQALPSGSPPTGLPAVTTAAPASQPTAFAPVPTPISTASGTGYGALMHDFGAADFQADPGYQFRVSEGEKALQRAKAASGSLGSGAFLKDAMTFNQGQASQAYGDAYSRYKSDQGTKLNALQALSGVGQSATNTLTGAAGTLGGQIGSNIIGAGNALASGQVGSANALTGGIGQGLSLYQQNQLMNRLPYYGGTPYGGTPYNPGAGTVGDFPSSYFG
jgi:hypothetical protein